MWRLYHSLLTLITTSWLWLWQLTRSNKNRWHTWSVPRGWGRALLSVTVWWRRKYIRRRLPGRWPLFPLPTCRRSGWGWRRECARPGQSPGGSSAQGVLIVLHNDQLDLISYKTHVGLIRYYIGIYDLKIMKESVSKLKYPWLHHCLRMLYTMNGNSKH